MLVIAAPAWSLMRVMWYSDGPGYDSNCHPKSPPQNSRAFAVSSAGISKWAISPGILPPLRRSPAEHGRSAASVLRQCRPEDLIGAKDVASAHVGLDRH